MPLRLGGGIYDTRIVALPPAPVTDLNDIEKVLSPKPLITNEELDRFYRDEVNEVRGEDETAKLARKYRLAFEAVPYKTFVTGHSGVGKSTEMTRLLRKLEDKFVGVRINVASEINPATFRVFDVLMIMMIKSFEAAKDRLGLGLLDAHVGRDLVEDLLGYFADEKHTSVEQKTVGGDAKAGVKGDSIWMKLFPIFATVQGEIKYSADRKNEIVAYRLKRLPDLVKLANRLIAFCRDELKRASGKEWLFVLEDFDQPGISGQQSREVFEDYGTVFQGLDANLIFTIPVWLADTQGPKGLPFPKTPILDTPVYDAFHAPHERGREAVGDVLCARVSADLMETGQVERLIVASGGNLRDLFFMLSGAAERTLVRDPAARLVREREVTQSIAEMRLEYRKRLGLSPFDKNPVPWEEKAKRLLAVYNSDPGSSIPDPVLYSLLRPRAVQEFNGVGWYGVHPLVVDMLKEQKYLGAEALGGSR